MLLGMLALTGLLLVGFAPVSWLFGQSTSSVTFIGLLQLAIWLVALSYGFIFLVRACRALGGGRGAHLATWCVIFTLVTLQMTSTLRPIIGASEQVLTVEKRFFLTHWFKTLEDEM